MLGFFGIDNTNDNQDIKKAILYVKNKSFKDVLLLWLPILRLNVCVAFWFYALSNSRRKHFDMDVSGQVEGCLLFYYFFYGSKRF